ncbi:co-chaperone DjlA [Neptunomonas qingdaonensis]|uniref:Co-chaperone protein DjlA n=1 Tax=Neptunomonas qingdaonensis TaxID=1045558 RepID=A0A1I2MVB1_9GAMM|nr:co-chaperone DjlA [Neptunomonas qingdaonensis]SFF95412.1 DnaJ like chaperone protein [Neptunomonas qingdaonensis]
MAIDAQATGQSIGASLLKYRGGVIVGALIGLMSGGFWGLVFGGVIGGLVSKAIVNVLTGGVSPQLAFFKATFAVMGKVAKADGRVTENEIQFARDVMARMNLSEERKREAMGYFSEGKEADFNIADVLSPLSRVIQSQAAVKIMFVEIQLQVAMADGQMSPAELAVVQEVCTLLRMSGVEMAALMSRMQAQQAYQQQSYQQHQHFQQASEQSLLKEAYGVLGVKEGDAEADIKKAYRRLMSQHHPDKLVAKGLPPEMMQLAKEKTQEIQAAYDRVKTARKN